MQADVAFGIKLWHIVKVAYAFIQNVDLILSQIGQVRNGLHFISIWRLGLVGHAACSILLGRTFCIQGGYALAVEGLGNQAMHGSSVAASRRQKAVLPSEFGQHVDVHAGAAKDGAVSWDHRALAFNRAGRELGSQLQGQPPPQAAAEVLSAQLNLPTSTDIVQANKPHRTGMDGLDRIFAAVDFDGPVAPGDYLLVDDTLTQGGTFASLASHIEQGGGRVVGAFTLTGKQYSATMQPSAETLNQLRNKHGDLEQDFRAATGHGFDALTQSEARYLASYEPAQRLRDRIVAERIARSQQENADDSEGGVAFARGGPDLFSPDTWSAPEPTSTDRIIYKLQDGRVDLKRIQQAIKATGAEIGERFDARLAETLYPGRVARRTETFLDREVRPLLEAMARAKATTTELADYLIARHAPERNAQVAETMSLILQSYKLGGYSSESRRGDVLLALARAAVAEIPK